MCFSINYYHQGKRKHAQQDGKSVEGVVGRPESDACQSYANWKETIHSQDLKAKYKNAVDETFTACELWLA